MIIGKEQFITKVSHCLGRTTLPKKPTRPLVYPHQMQHRYMATASSQELLDSFIANAQSVGIDIDQCNENELAETLVQIIRKLGGPVMLANHPLLTGEVSELLCRELNECHVWSSASSQKKNMARAEEAKFGIAVAEAALAETATSVLFSEQGNGRSVTLLPENSLIIIRGESILPRLTQIMKLLQSLENLPSSINFISGPSSTADIELVRVQGVHGPLGLNYIIIT